MRAVLYGCETWPVTLSEGNRLRVFENRVLKKTPGPKGSEIIAHCKKIRNEEHYDLHCSLDIITLIKKEN